MVFKNAFNSGHLATATVRSFPLRIRLASRVLEYSRFSPYRRVGPVNWTPRFDAMFLDGAGFKMFLRYLENNPVRAHTARKAKDWRWSSARAHCAGKDAGGVLCLDVWRHLFDNPAVAAEAWVTFLDGPEEEVRRNAGRRAGPYNRVAWSVPVVTLRAGSPPG